ncbi:hypothetical protein T09_11682 [Trichinella sp. T9]|nr:hypothetical protein T09_11682 [Trichinella sp. T9]
MVGAEGWFWRKFFFVTISSLTKWAAMERITIICCKNCYYNTQTQPVSVVIFPSTFFITPLLPIRFETQFQSKTVSRLMKSNKMIIINHVTKNIQHLSKT